MQAASPQTIRQEICSVISLSPPRHLQRALVSRACQMAVALVRMRRRSGKWRFLDPLLSDYDVAIDTLADALSRDAEGRLDQLCAYFFELNWEELDDEELVTALRRFVFRKVEDGVYRMFQERDPQLARLIRVLRNAANAEDDVELVRRAGTLWVCVDGATPFANASTMPLELLERRLRVREGDTAPDMMCSVKRVLRYQELHTRAVPLTGLALAIRAVLVHAEMDSERQEDDAAAFEWEDRVRGSVTRVCERLWPSYQSRVPQKVFEGYREAAILVFARGYPQSAAVEVCVDGAGTDYRSTHRKVFEYIVRNVRADLRAFYRSEDSAISVH